MAIIDDCTPEEALWRYHNQGLDVLEQSMQQQIDALAPMLADVDAALTEMNQVVIDTFGDEPAGSCTLPQDPSLSDIETAISTPSLSIVRGRIVLPGELSLVALRRLYGIFGSLDQVARYIPEFSIAAIDPDFGNIGLDPRLLVIELRLQTQVTTPNTCAPDDVITEESEVLVGVNSALSEDEPDRIVVAVWIGPTELNDGLRQHMVELGFTDDEIIATVTLESRPGFEVYSITDPHRLWKFAQTFITEGEGVPSVDDLGTLLSRPIDAVDDDPAPATIGRAMRAAMSTPAVPGCGFPVALGLLSTIDMGKLVKPLDHDCDLNPDIFGPVNEIFGAMGSIQRTIDKVLASYQNTVGKTMSRLASTVTDIERKYLGRGLASATITGPSQSLGISANYLRASSSLNTGTVTPSVTPANAKRLQPMASNGAKTPGLPNEPEKPNIDTDDLTAIVNVLNSNMQLITDSVNAVTQVVIGMSLMMCSVSWLGNTINRFQPNIGLSDHLFKFARPKCADAQLTANIDFSGINFDLCNLALSMLKDLLHRLLSLLDSMLTAARSSNALLQLNCSITETTQLAADVGRRLAAHNWGRF